jgi:hypothetical protein
MLQKAGQRFVAKEKPKATINKALKPDNSLQ